ncbi:MAG TPA: homocysteine S-methyltransferase family protein [Alphaproteobacteria bacterium]|nr:homocysteine S-methyltransferase family protein [Alphaproteobacteria bacterium]
MSDRPGAAPGLLERLKQGPVICAEGYLFELERRGHLQAGAFVPEVVLEDPDAVRQLHREFLHAGSDVMVALTYYGHREKLRLVGREGDLERLNREAIRLARQVAAEEGALVAGDLSNTNLYDPTDPASLRQVRAIFEEQVGWAVDEGVDFILSETMSWLGEAEIALDVMKAAGLPTVVNITFHQPLTTREGVAPAEACRRLEDAGADVVGLNCMRGPRTMLPLLREIRAAIRGPLAALPVPYRTDAAHPTFQSLEDPGCGCIPGGKPFPTALDPFTCNRYEIGEFTRAAQALGVGFFGLCCGAAPHHVRAMAEALGRRPKASRFSPDMSRHAFLGTDPSLKQVNRDYAERL